MPRGRPKRPLWHRLADKLTVDVGGPPMPYETIDLAGRDPADWPQDLHKPWFWIGATTKPGYRQKVMIDYHNGGKYPTMVWCVERPQFRIGREISNRPHYLVWELFNGPLPPKHTLRYHGSPAWYLNLNPMFWYPKPDRRAAGPEYELPEEPELVQPLSDEQDIEDLRHLLNEFLMVGPLPPLADLVAYFQGDFTEQQIRLAAEREGISNKLN